MCSAKRNVDASINFQKSSKMVDSKGNLTISSGIYDTQVSDLLSDNMPGILSTSTFQGVVFSVTVSFFIASDIVIEEALPILSDSSATNILTSHYALVEFLEQLMDVYICICTVEC
ncbi:hypothetical protein GJ496_007613 [Pomphorhynchus laevis]|nr:hypothetical protein GJ496_007613 [Pomphorhynchus laevis]